VLTGLDDARIDTRGYAFTCARMPILLAGDTSAVNASKAIVGRRPRRVAGDGPGDRITRAEWISGPIAPSGQRLHVSHDLQIGLGAGFRWPRVPRLPLA
jgi:hypothetical protein